MNIVYAKGDYVLHEKIDAEFDDFADMSYWAKKMRAKGYKVTEVTGYAIGKPNRAIALRNRLRRTFDFEAIGVGKGKSKRVLEPRKPQ